MSAHISFGGKVIDPSQKIGRVEVDGEVFVSLTDMLYLCDVSSERHVVMGDQCKADTMEQFAFILSMMLRD